MAQCSVYGPSLLWAEFLWAEFAMGCPVTFKASNMKDLAFGRIKIHVFSMVAYFCHEIAR